MFYLILLACSDPEVAQLREEVAALKASQAQLQRELSALREQVAADARPTVTVDARTGELVPDLSADRVLACAHGNLNGVLTAETAYNAAFDEYTTDLERLGWSMDTRDGCHRYLHISVTSVTDDDFTAEALVIAGDERGRRFRVTAHRPVVEVE